MMGNNNNNVNNANDANFPAALISSVISIVLISLLLFTTSSATTSIITASSVKPHRARHAALAPLSATLRLLYRSLRTTYPVTQASSSAWSLLTTPPSAFFPFCFMPSAQSTTLLNAPDNQSFPATQSSPNQHGIHLSSYSSDHSLPGSGPESPSSPPGETDANPHPQPPTTAEHGHLAGNLDGSDTRRILNSSRSSADVKGKSAGHKKFKHPNAKGQTYITTLPNEVLTHTLSFLDPVSLTSVSYVSRRFHALVTSPHAWKDAFSRYFPQHNTHAGSDVYPSTTRYFTRLSNMGTHRSEYILRTQLLRSLKRGRPYVHSGIKPSSSHNSSNFSMITYNPKLHESTVTHLHADFSRNRVIAASQYTGLYSYSDPRTGYVEVDQRGHPGYSSFGLQYISHEGIGAIDVSEPKGQIIGDARDSFPSFFVERASSTLAPLRFINEHGPNASITCIWLAKKDTIINTSGHRIASASGSSKGVVQFQDASNSWMSFNVCPGIPILEIRIDDGYTKARERRNRIWCIIVNALGEVWYMKGKLPKRTLVLGRNMGEQPEPEFTPWYFIPSTRKKNAPVGIGILAPEDPAPSLEAMQQQQTWMHADSDIMAVTYVDDWREDYFIEADFGGQNFVVGCRGGDEGLNSLKQRAAMTKYTRTLDKVREESISEVFIKNVYGRGYHKQIEELVPRPQDETDPPDEWHTVELLIPRNTGKDYAFITAVAIDMSNIALLSPNEDPLLTRSTNHPLTPHQVVGQLARLFAIGTDNGTIHIYNSRHPISSSTTVLPPLHTIITASPSISSLALSSLYLVHGGTDGLVQAWDPLVSLTEPIRAIHSRFSTRARRRLAQAANSVQGIGENQFAARAIFLDPDPTQLRGIVALGAQIRSWSFSSSVEKVQENSNSRRRRKNARRGSNNNPYLGPGAISGKGRGGNSSKALLPKDILDETERIAHTRYQDEAKKARMAARFGVGHEGMKGMTEEEMVMYAMMISEESFEKERGLSEESGGADSSVGVDSVFGEGEEVWIYSESNGESASAGISESPSSPVAWLEPVQLEAGTSSSATGAPLQTNDDEALAKALQESFDLEESQPSPNSGIDIPIKFAKSKNKKGKGKGASLDFPSAGPSSGNERQGNDEQFDRDLELAIQLSMKQ
ncbi:hypothetical protein H072_2645 [Dactylellina haptotyla CBS 200.50]|uniref:F-box domain-containing protein n=1 Tax=Dactylellina haptotyla (strain CBS 200.50) TaxID=1284197 RepID=S8C6L7_DACHA|nr:hypothetical protein H072_2645 [Dactylellina haptotyla CBS 200.50]